MSLIKTICNYQITKLLNYQITKLPLRIPCLLSTIYLLLFCIYRRIVMRPLLCLCAFVPLCLFLSGCGGGGTTEPPTVTLSGQVLVPEGTPSGRLFASSRQANRTLENAKVLLFIDDALRGETTTNSNGQYTFYKLPIGIRIKLYAKQDKIDLRTIIDVDTNTANINNFINATSTATFILYDELKTKYFNAKIDEIAKLDIINTITPKIVTNLQSGSPETFESMKNSSEVKNVTDRLKNQTETIIDTSKPAVIITYPLSDTEITEEEFLNSNFKISFSYSDNTAIYAIASTLKVDNSEEINLTPYFTLTQGQKIATLYTSNLLVPVLRKLFTAVSNNITRRASAITVKCEDSFGNTTTATSNFNISPTTIPILPGK